MGTVARELKWSRTGLYRLPNFMKLVNADRGQTERTSAASREGIRIR